MQAARINHAGIILVLLLLHLLKLQVLQFQHCLSQFFEEDDDSVYLSAEQQHLINRWNQLTDKEKQTISDTMDLILGQRK